MRQKEAREAALAAEETKYKFLAQIMEMIRHDNDAVRRIGMKLLEDFASKHNIDI